MEVWENRKSSYPLRPDRRRENHSVQPAEHILETYHPQAATGAGYVRFVPVWGAMTVFVAGAALIAGMSVALCAPMLTGLVIYACFAGPICLAAILSRIRQVSQASDRTVSLKGGDVTVTTSRGSESHPLEACCWFRGKVTDEPDFSYQPIRRKAIVIVFPTGRTVACGLDEEFYIILGNRAAHEAQFGVGSHPPCCVAEWLCRGTWARGVCHCWS